MQDFSFLLGNDFKLPQIDVYGPYKQALTLRQLADAREYQRAQRRHMQLQEQDALEKRQRAEQLRQLFRGGTAPTREQILATDPIGGMALIKEMDALEKEERLKASATTEAQAKKTEQQRKINQAVANIGMQAVQIPDPAEREQYFQQQMAGTLIDAGITPAEQFGSFPVPRNEKEAQFAYANAYDPKALQDYLKGEREKTSAALKTSGDQLDIFGRLLGGVRTQADWSAVVQSAPLEIRSLLNPKFSPDELKRAQDMVLTAQQRAQAQQQGQPNTLLEMRRAVTDPATPPDVKAQLEATIKAEEDFQLQRKAQTDAEALAATVMANPSVWENLTPAAQTQLAPRLAELGFKGFGKAPSAELQKKQLALANYKKAIKAYRDELNSTDPSAVPGRIPRLKALYTDMTLQAKEAANLGALAGPDWTLIQGLYSDPNSIAGAWVTGKSGLLAQLDVGDAIVKRNEESLAEVYGQKAGGKQQTPPAQPQPSATPAPAPSPVLNTKPPEKPPAGKPFGVAAPDGNTYWFATKADADGFRKRAGIR